jgi:hypothetical protein
MLGCFSQIELREMDMTAFNHCRFCDDWRDQGLVHYGTRHYAHFRCYLEKGKPLDKLEGWQLGKFPFRLLREFSVTDENGEFRDPVLGAKFKKSQAA